MRFELLEKSRENLLDFGFRNNFIHTKDQSKRIVRVVQENSLEVFRILVEKGNIMSFKPKEDQIDEADDEFNQLYSLPPPDVEDESKLTDRILQTLHSPKDLQRRLRNIQRVSKLSTEEKGVNMLFLALGFIHWYEDENSQILRKAPIVLVPVKLSRSSIKSPFKISFNEDDIGMNISFFAKVKKTYGLDIEIPQEIDSSNLLELFDDLSKKLNFDRWKINENEIKLGLFSFGNFLMYNDLDPNTWPEDAKPYDHEILSNILEEGFYHESSLGSSDFGDDIPYKETYHVLPADSSQQEVIFSIREGLSTVVQGPPGSGKSQTITNIICDFLARGKKVLFVAEKLAALKVVSNRLSKLGLGIVGLELHSDKTNKKSFLRELEKVLNSDLPTINIDFQEALDQAEQIRKEINAYSQAVNQTIGDTGFTPIQVFGYCLKAKKSLSESIYHIDYDKITAGNYHQYTNLLNELNQIQNQLKELGSLSSSPFFQIRPKNFDFIEKEEFLRKIKLLFDVLKSIESKILHIVEKSKVFSMTSSWNDLQRLSKTLEFIKQYDSHGVELNFRNRVFSNSKNIEELINLSVEVLDIQQKIKEVSDLVNSRFWNLDVFIHYQNLTDSSSKWYKGIIGRYRKSKKSLKVYYTNPNQKISDAQLMDLCQRNIKGWDINKKITDLNHLIKKMTDEKLEHYSDRWEDFLHSMNWYLKFNNELKNSQVFEKGIDLVNRKELIQDLEVDLLPFENAYSQLFKTLEEVSYSTSKSIKDEEITSVIGMLDLWISNESIFTKFCDVVSKIEDLKDQHHDWIIEIIENWDQADQNLVDIFQYYWFRSIAQKTLHERPELSRFDGSNHSHKVHEYSQYEDKLLEINKYRVLIQHYEKIPKTNIGGGKLGMLKAEFAKKRKIKPIRKIITQCDDLLLDLKPLFLMSPLAIAQFIDKNSLQFDLVIFDEASQIKPVESFGAILRAKQMVVVGDKKQLPPTSFFDMAEDESQEDNLEFETSDVESILALAEAKNVSQTMLKWHYRSKHQSLIAVSNREFYDSRLIIFPSPIAKNDTRGLHHYHTKNTYYAPGKGGSVNLKEAQLIIQEVIHHAIVNPDKTLGVVAFSQSQARLIEDHLEQELRINPNPRVEKYLFSDHPDERFFVKNLENVQGDERDFIFISVGYGHQESGKFSYNFGPVNKTGGERRLNVLFSRSKLKCVVFSNFKGSEIDTTKVNSYGVRVLKTFLNYADSREFQLAEVTNGHTDSVFESQVSDFLIKNGIDIANQVKSQGFKIDIAVKHPKEKGRFILAIECDGATYHSSRIARDRDKSRQLILEMMGWKFYRIWSTDWFRNNQIESQRLLDYVRNLIEDEAKDNDSTEIQNQPNSLNESVENSTSTGSESNPIEENQSKVTIEYQKDLSSDDEIGSYETFVGEVILHQELHEYWRLDELLHQIIQQEQPIHYELLLTRVRKLTNIKRAGQRIRRHYDYMLSILKKNHQLKSNNSFFYFEDKFETPSKNGLIRKRSDLPRDESPFEFISKHEIQNAIMLYLDKSYGAVQFEELSSGVSRIFGFSRVTNQISDLISKEKNALIGNKFVKDENGMLSLLTMM